METADFIKVYKELISRGEHSITIGEGKREGLICTMHGKNTHNFWEIVDGELVCVDTSNGSMDTYFSPYTKKKDWEGKTIYVKD